MTEEKARHKPQQKRTLEEVLRSLQDLVRNDLVSERASRPASHGEARSPHDDPDAFNEALTRLNEAIDEKIIRPAAQAPRAFPEPEPADDGLEMDRAGAVAADTNRGGRAAERDAEARAIDAAAPDEGPIFDFDAPPLETVEPPEETPAADPSPELQQGFRFADPAAGHGARAEDERPKPIAGRDSNRAAPAAGTQMAAAPNENVAATPRPEKRVAGTDPALSGGGDDRMTATPESADTTPEAPNDRRSPGAPEDRAAAVEPPTLDEEIPVLNEVAGVDAPPAEGRPDPARARDVAVRAVARLNIERRKAGEPPLDVKTIERLQQYLAEALANPRAGMP